MIKKSAKDLTWLKVDNSVLSNNKKDLKQQNWSGMSQILCKIGMTTKPNVQLRLNEWENTCSHKVINLTPSNIDMLIDNQSESHGVHRLSKLMSKLSLKTKDTTSGTDKKTKSIIHCRNLKLYTYKNGGFYADGQGAMSLQNIENSLHQLLWKKYGKGIVHCSGCQKEGTVYKKHIEWFVIPVSDLPYILQTVDNFCFSQNKMLKTYKK